MLSRTEKTRLPFAVACFVVICPGGHRRVGGLSTGWPMLQLDFLRLVAAAQVTWAEVRLPLDCRVGAGSREASL